MARACAVLLFVPALLAPASAGANSFVCKIISCAMSDQSGCSTADCSWNATGAYCGPSVAMGLDLAAKVAAAGSNMTVVFNAILGDSPILSFLSETMACTSATSQAACPSSCEWTTGSSACHISVAKNVYYLQQPWFQEYGKSMVCSSQDTQAACAATTGCSWSAQTESQLALLKPLGLITTCSAGVDAVKRVYACDAPSGDPVIQGPPPTFAELMCRTAPCGYQAKASCSGDCAWDTVKGGCAASSSLQALMDIRFSTAALTRNMTDVLDKATQVGMAMQSQCEGKAQGQCSGNCTWSQDSCDVNPVNVTMYVPAVYRPSFEIAMQCAAADTQRACQDRGCSWQAAHRVNEPPCAPPLEARATLWGCTSTTTATTTRLAAAASAPLGRGAFGALFLSLLAAAGVGW